MGANAQTTVPTFTAAQVLTADQMNQSARTGVPVFADTTARDAGFGGSGEKTLAEGQLCYVENLTGIAQLQYYDGATWISFLPNGLVYLTGASFTSATSVSLPNSTFTSAYRNYRLVFQITAAGSDADITMRLRASGSDISSSNYDNAWTGFTNTAAASNVGSVSNTAWNLGEIDTGAPWCYMMLDVIAPQVTTNTFVTGQYAFVDKTGVAYVTRNGSGVFRLTTSVDALTVISSAASAMTGVYRVYGYSES